MLGFTTLPFGNDFVEREAAPRLRSTQPTDLDLYKCREHRGEFQIICKYSGGTLSTNQTPLSEQ